MLIAQISEESGPSTPAAQKAFAKLLKLGAGGIPKIFEALAMADKKQTAEYVDVLSKLITDKSLMLVARGSLGLSIRRPPVAASLPADR